MALTLLSWLLPLMTLIGGGFVVALAFTGLRPLWGTGHASGVLLAATAALIILVNATYQDGERVDYPPAVLKWSGRIAAGLLTPLVLVAIYGAWLRIHQHGLTPMRVYSIACLLMAAVYAGGYAWASFGRTPWMRRLERVNVIAAHLAVLVLLAVFSPLADPARLSVGDQVARLRSGQVEPERFDYRFLRFDSGRWGRDALAKLAESRPGFVRDRAAETLRLANRYAERDVTTTERQALLKPLGAPLPADFLEQSWPRGAEPTSGCAEACVALLQDFDGDGSADILVVSPHRQQVYGRRQAGWKLVGRLDGPGCGNLQDALQKGAFALEPARGVGLRAKGGLYVFIPSDGCSSEVTDAALIRPR